MELFELEQLAAFAEHKTLSAAAEILHVSQPTLTKTMKRLEDEFDVPLFIRTKNRITLNENGLLAAEQSKKILQQTADMVQLVRALERSNHTINIGGCASIPISRLVRMLSDTYPDMTISSEIKPRTQLISGLWDDVYQFIILPEKPECMDGLLIAELGEEHLMFSLPQNHPLADSDGLYLSDLNGQNMIVLPNLGFWGEIIEEKMPDSKFLVQTGKVSFEELIQASVLPSFTSDLALLEYLQPDDRVTVPILDPEVNVTFCYITKEESRKKYPALFI